ncbi:MAG: amidase [Alphaproteobacteria bacterium]|nr:amidase [Alphaproteobacteria bacterium]
MNKEDLCFTPATKLADMIARKKLSPVELMDTVLERAEALNPKLNAICTWTADQARDRAKKAEQAVMKGKKLGALHGIPITLKDLLFTKGVRTMGGSHIFATRVPEVDAPAAERLAAAGAISIGKTTVPELGWKGCGDSPVTGISHNPWKLGYNAGGSSTGAAICTAAGIGPIHQGSDGAGSVRMPAGFCGIYGLKPSFGRVAAYPTGAADQISHVGPMTRTVADAALMLNAMAGPDDRDATSLEASPPDYLKGLDKGVKGLRVAFSANLGYLKVDEEVAVPVAKAAKAFEALGAHVEEVSDPGWGDPTDMELFFYASWYAASLGPILDKWEKYMDPGLVACTRAGFAYTAAEYVRMRLRRFEYYDKVQAFFGKYDLLLTPTLSVAAFKAGDLIPSHWEQHPWDWIRWAGFSYPFNLTWNPAATCPCGFTPAGLPVGIQIVGRRFRDDVVLQASRAFEKARPWAEARPKL